MRFLVGLASIVLGVALLAGFVYRDAPGGLTTAQGPAAAAPTSRSNIAAKAAPLTPKITAPKVVGDIADAQPTILNADRSRFEPLAAPPTPEPVTQSERDRERRILIMALQGELRRVGCYQGGVDGQWKAASKAALFWFLKRVNAKLPVNQPDQAQLNLLKSAANDACADEVPQSEFITQVKRQDDVAEGVPNPTSPIQDTSFSAARQRAGLPSTVNVDLTQQTADAASTDLELPEPMAVGRVESQKKRRNYRRTSKRVETLFKHPLGRF